MDKIEFINSLVTKMKELSTQAKQMEDIPQPIKSSLNALLLLGLRSKKEFSEKEGAKVVTSTPPAGDRDEVSFLRALIKKKLDLKDEEIDEQFKSDKEEFNMTEVNSLKAMLKNSGIDPDDHPALFLDFKEKEDAVLRRVVMSAGIGRPEVAKRVEQLIKKIDGPITVIGALLVFADKLGVKTNDLYK